MIACSLAPSEGIIAMDFNSPQEVEEYIKKKNLPITHWVLSGVIDDDIGTLFEKKDGVVLLDRFDQRDRPSKKNSQS